MDLALFSMDSLTLHSNPAGQFLCVLDYNPAGQFLYILTQWGGYLLSNPSGQFQREQGLDHQIFLLFFIPRNRVH